ncbi:Cysteine desulfurase [hydrothermal vent metagenome]|uniref:Cysteine desulfurase n=1 Tax=hydrothermal vent metagenome TaxID=652676 RepID=A0A3B0VHT2_9ZZZZ
MRNLEVYRQYFEQAYPKYADGEYTIIAEMIHGLPSVDNATNTLNSDCANQVLALILPLIKIKNYKSQIPFPVAIYDAVREITKLKNTNPLQDLSGEQITIFEQLLNIEGFQLPTVSAVFHFCHPRVHPIVDRNIQGACNLLATEFQGELNGVPLPILPAANTSIRNKLAKYRDFISFLAAVKGLHNNQHQTEYDYRDLDQALMVYGVPNMKVAAENHANN